MLSGLGVFTDSPHATLESGGVLGIVAPRMLEAVAGLTAYREEALRVLPDGIFGSGEVLRSLVGFVDSERILLRAKPASSLATPFGITAHMESFAAQTTLSETAAGVLRTNIASVAASAALVGSLGARYPEQSTAFRVGASLLRSFQGFQVDTFGRDTLGRAGVDVAASRIATEHLAGAATVLTDAQEPAEGREVDDFPGNVYGALRDEIDRLGPSLDGADADLAASALDGTHAAMVTRLGAEVTAYRLQVDVAWKTLMGVRLFVGIEERGWWGAVLASTIVTDERTFAEYVGWLDRFIVEASGGLKAATSIPSTPSATSSAP